MKNSSNNTKIVILGLSIFICTVVYLAWISFSLQNYGGNSSNVLVEIPEISVPILSTQNNTYHDVSIEFFLQVNSNDMSTLNLNQLESDITQIVENMNYDNVSSIGNMNYIKSNVIDNLNTNNDVEILNIYISNIFS